MSRRRVVITGMGAVSPLGVGCSALFRGLEENTSGIRANPELGNVQGLRPGVAGLVGKVDSKQIPRAFRRSMSPMSVYAVLACQEALEQAGVSREMLHEARAGLALGSTLGSVGAMQDFFQDYLTDFSIERTKTSTFFKLMGHSAAANVSKYLGIRGPVLAPASACATGCQSVGLGYEAIAHGNQTMMLCGGSDEFHPLTVATFDILQAASFGYNDTPDRTPRPFDKDRDGVVCAEGGGVLLLESLDSALARGAPVLAEIIGTATTSDPVNMANPDSRAMADCIRLAIRDAGLEPRDIDMVNAHATGTLQGDVAECRAIADVVGEAIPVNSFKGHLGHTMAASGALELIASIHMVRRGICIPTKNLEQPDPNCSCVDLVLNFFTKPIKVILKNSFALGGVNSVIVVRGCTDVG